MSRPGEVYGSLQKEVVATVMCCTAESLASVVPQCPDWTVHDVISHVTGIADDILAGRTEGLGSDEWTAAQVDPRRTVPTAEVCEEWSELVARLAPRLVEEPFLAVRLTADLVTHQHDLATALDVPAPRDSAAVRLGLERYGPFFCERADAAGKPTIRIEAVDTGQGWQSTDGQPRAVLTATAFELLRSFSGRRTPSQVLALNWSFGDERDRAEDYLSVVSPYGLPSEVVAEP